jgi:hypothetical protein
MGFKNFDLERFLTPLNVFILLLLVPVFGIAFFFFSPVHVFLLASLLLAGVLLLFTCLLGTLVRLMFVVGLFLIVFGFFFL